MWYCKGCPKKVHGEAGNGRKGTTVHGVSAVEHSRSRSIMTYSMTGQPKTLKIIQACCRSPKQNYSAAATNTSICEAPMSRCGAMQYLELVVVGVLFFVLPSLQPRLRHIAIGMG